MISKCAMIGSLIFAGVLTAFGATVHADNINTSGVSCRSFAPFQALDIGYSGSGVFVTADTARDVICPVPRSPLTTSPSPSFYVDGSNAPGTSTSCEVISVNYDGTFLGAQFIGETVSGTVWVDWDRFVTFPIEQLPTYAYVSVLCTLPGSANGEILGVTAVQP